MLVGIPLLEQRPGIVRPLVVAKALQIVTHVPCDVGERSEPSYSVADEPAFVLTAGVGMNMAVVHIENERNDHVLRTRVGEHPIPFLPIGQVEARIVEARMEKIIRLFPPARREHKVQLGPVITGSPKAVFSRPAMATRMRLTFRRCSRAMLYWMVESSRQPISQYAVVPLKK